MTTDPDARFLIRQEGHSVINVVIGTILVDSVDPAKHLPDAERKNYPGKIHTVMTPPTCAHAGVQAKPAGGFITL